MKSKTLPITYYLLPQHGIHFYQEDQPEVIGRNLANWYRRHIGPKRK